MRLKMDEASIDPRAGEEVEQQLSLKKDIGLAEHCISEITADKFKRLLAVQIEKEFPSASKQQFVGNKCIQGSLYRGAHSTDQRIPKYMRFASLNENYLQYCLELVEFRAANSLGIVCRPAVPCNVSVNLISSFDNKLEPGRHIRRITSDLGPFVIQCPPSTRTGQWILNAIDRKQSVTNILGDPLLHHFGAVDSVMNIARVGLIDIKGTKDTSSMISTSGFSVSSPKKLETERCVGNQTYGSKSSNKWIFSISDARSTGSNQSSASSSATFSQGMLHCKWENGVLYFMYSIDGQKEVYVATVLKVESSDYKELEYIYSFYMKKGGRKAHRTSDNSLDDLVGKMKVSSSLTFCSNSDNSRLMETEFVLFSTDSKQFGNAASSDTMLGKTKAYPHKGVDIFRPKHLLKHKSSLKFGAQSSITDDFSLDPCESNKPDMLGSEKFQGCPPNIELAAIIVNEQVRDNHQETVVGGWGLKFLEKAWVERANTSQEASASSDTFQETCPKAKSGYSTNMNVIIPAGFHGGPRTRNGGPSGLTERWRSGGHCDCGGWDMGCPLTVLNNKSSREVSTSACIERESKSLNLVLKGSKESAPSLKMASFPDDKYQIQFQSSISVLQSFSIGVATIHTQCHSLISKNVQKLNQ